MTKTDDRWPLVLKDDDGIRPAGRDDECFYCSRRVGEPHKRDCVMVQKLIEFRVTATVDEKVVLTGLWRCEVPHHWDTQMTEFHKNDSSWCADNFLDEEHAKVTLDGATLDAVSWSEVGDLGAWSLLKGQSDENYCCLCSVLHFRLARVLDDAPRTRPPRAKTENR